MTELKSK